MRAAAVIAVSALTLAACGAEADKASPTSEVVAGPAVAAPPATPVALTDADLRRVCRAGLAAIHGQDEDSITIDAKKQLIQLNVSAKEIAARRKKWKQPKPRYTRGLLGKYVKLVSTASKGAITDHDD